MNNNLIKIGTRSSELACWQAQEVSNKLEQLGFATKLIKISSKGDIILDKPLYKMGVIGVFTKDLDLALINKEVDIVVHSLKDVPTQLPKGVEQIAVLKRGSVSDIAMLHPTKTDIEQKSIFATSSLRRKAQWLNKYPSSTIVDLRGNVNLRLQKLNNSNWHGAIFAKAGLERVNLLKQKYIELDWMIPAPAQGAVMVAGLKTNKEINNICKKINHKPTELCVGIERDFLKTLEGGCTAPIGAYAYINKKNEIIFEGGLFSLDGKDKILISKKEKLENSNYLGKLCAEQILKNGGELIMNKIKKELK